MTSSSRRRRWCDVRHLLVVVDVRRLGWVGALVPDARRAEVVRYDAVTHLVCMAIEGKKIFI
jgi:hypothetical protein